MLAPVAPGILPLAVAGLLGDQPAGAAVARGPNPPGADGDEPAAQPASAPFPPGHTAPRPRRKRPDQDIGALDAAAPGEAHGEVAADGVDIALTPLLQAIQEV